jgi:hypothetical protein
VIGAHDWWPGLPLGLALAWLTWDGRRIGNVVLIAALWWWLGAVPALVALAMAAAHLVEVRFERNQLLYRTGVRLTEAQHRRHIRLGSRRAAAVVTRQVSFRRRRRLALEGAGAR